MKTVIVTSAIPLTEELTKLVKSFLKKKVASDFKLDLRVDPQTIGGLKIMIDGKIFDATVARKLRELL